MRWLSEIRQRFRWLASRERHDAEMDDELRFHLEMEAQENVRRGMSPEDARRRALISFGGLERHRIQLREGRRLPVVEELWLDMRYSVRALRRSRGPATVIVLTLALGIGASVAIHSIFRTLISDPVPFAEPDQLVSVRLSGARGSGLNPSYADLSVWEAEAASVVDLAGYATRRRMVGDGSRTWFAWVTSVTPGFFDVLALRPLLGRTFTTGDAGAVVVVTQRLWERELGADPEIIGKSLRVDGRPHEVVGVLPAGLEFPSPADAWVPLPPSGGEGGPLFPAAIGRLADSATALELEVTLETVQGRLDAERPAEERASGVALWPLAGPTVEGASTSLLLIQGTALMLLLIGVTNAASLMLARGLERTREVAVRVSLGAGRMRIVRQLLVESSLLAAAAGALGMLVAHLTIAAMDAAAPESMARRIFGWERLGLDMRSAVFGVALAALTGLAFGLVPAVAAARSGTRAGLRAGGPAATGGRGWSRLTRVMLGGEVAVALLLLLCGGLFASSLVRVVGADPGFEPEGTLSVQWGLPPEGYEDPGAISRFQEALLGRVRALPGVHAAALTLAVPMSGLGLGARMEYRVQGGDPAAESPSAGWRPITPGYLETMGVTLLAGRRFSAEDGAAAPRVVMVNETLAGRHWSDGRLPVGQRIEVDGEAWTIVGVARDVRDFGVERPASAMIFAPQAQSPTSRGELVVRADDSGALAPRLREAIWATDPDVAVGAIRPVDDLVRDFFADQRMMVTLLVVFACTAMLITVTSIYALVAHAVNRRWREIGIRLALGARPRQILGAAMAQGMKGVAAGTLAGVALSVGAARLLAGLLYGIGPIDPIVFTLVPSGLLIVGLLASYLPARRAVRVDPVASLRSD